MTEPTPFTPPGGAPPLPAPTGSPIGTTFPTLPPPPRRRAWLVPVIVVGSLAVVGLIAGVAFAAIQLATAVSQAPAAGPGSAPIGTLDDLLEGDPGSPVAVDPLDCAAACFGIDHARELEIPADAYAAIGLSEGDDEVYQITAGKDQIDQTKWWRADGGTPDACYFGYPRAPLFFSPGDPGDPTAERDPLYYPEWHHDSSEYYYFTEGIRVFADSGAATAHLAELESAIAGCPDYAFAEAGWFNIVTATPALDLPNSVAAYGWAESGGLNRFYGVDLQRGNLVARLTLTTDPGGPTETEFRHLVETYAVLLAELEPAG